MSTVRVLHVVGQMKRAGVETWLMNLLRRADPGRLCMDFLVGSPEEGHYDAEIRTLGSVVLHAAPPSSPVPFARGVQRILRQGGYHAVHSHVHFYSGFMLALAHRAGVPVRIAHSHLDSADQDRAASAPRRLYLAAMRRAIHRHATRGLGCTAAAAAALFGEDWRDDPRWGVMHCALDLAPFRAPLHRDALRAGLGVPTGAPLVVHVGRFDEQKNHRFLLRIAAAVLGREPGAWFVLVGEGPLRPAVEEEARRLGVHPRVRFAGVRPDVPALMRASDLFLLPSLREGLPLVGIEAEAAGIPLVLADNVTRELDVVPGLLHRRSLSDAPEAWADTVVELLHAPRPAPGMALSAMERSDFSLERSMHLLEDLYRPPPWRGAPSPEVRT